MAADPPRSAPHCLPPRLPTICHTTCAVASAPAASSLNSCERERTASHFQQIISAKTDAGSPTHVRENKGSRRPDALPPGQRILPPRYFLFDGPIEGKGREKIDPHLQDIGHQAS